MWPRQLARTPVALRPTVPPRWQRLGYRSRAYLKLNELNDKLRLLRPGMRALELGSAPGSWTQVLVEHEIETLAIDILPMEPVCTTYARHVHDVTAAAWA